jgi:hypothetical protein
VPHVVLEHHQFVLKLWEVQECQCRQARDLEDMRGLVGDLRDEPRSSAHAVVRRLQRLPHSRKSTRHGSVR